MTIAFYDSDDQGVCINPTTTNNDHNSNDALNPNEQSDHFEIPCGNCIKDLIGNSKRFRIENNKKSIQIIGNNNRIKIKTNSAQIQIIGNNNKLKILENHGYIKYTGNNGRISIGNDSINQCVDYTGCNGTLKIFNPKTFQMTNNEKTSPINSNYINNLKNFEGAYHQYPDQHHHHFNPSRSHSGSCICTESHAFLMKSFQTCSSLNLNTNLNLKLKSCCTENLKNKQNLPKCLTNNKQNRNSSQFNNNLSSSNNNSNITIFKNIKNAVIGNQFNITI